MTESCTCDVSIKESRIFSRQPIRVGCAGWSIPRLAAAHFGSRGSHLERYSQAFNSCEINSSFYRPHKKETWEKWARSVPAEFRFSVKAPKTITHEAKLNCSSEVLSAFLEQINCLHERLGPVLIQLPPSLEFDYARARKFLSLLRRSFSGDIVWEPRHSSWFDTQADDLLIEFQIARVAARPGVRPCRHPALWSGKFGLLSAPRVSPPILLCLLRRLFEYARCAIGKFKCKGACMVYFRQYRFRRCNPKCT
jgi:uncharacterized protein YecE (DUF72 family)